jgi:hypothetical protein
MSDGKRFLGLSAGSRGLAILSGAVLVAMAGCADTPSSERGPDAPTPTRPAHETSSVNLRQSNADAGSEQEVALRSVRWKTEGRVDDFLWLVVHAIPGRTSKSRVEELLGRPLGDTRLSEWVYVKADPAEKQVDSLSLLFDAEDLLEEFRAVPQNSEELRLGLGVPDTPPETPTEVREAFVAQVRPFVRRVADRPEDEYLRPLISQSLLVVRRQLCSRALGTLDRILPQSERATMIVHGSLDALRRDGECWTVEDSGMGVAMIGCLDEPTWELLILANPPRQ